MASSSEATPRTVSPSRINAWPPAIPANERRSGSPNRSPIAAASRQAAYAAAASPPARPRMATGSSR